MTYNLRRYLLSETHSALVISLANYNLRSSAPPHPTALLQWQLAGQFSIFLHVRVHHAVSIAHVLRPLFLRAQATVLHSLNFLYALLPPPSADFQPAVTNGQIDHLQAAGRALHGTQSCTPVQPVPTFHKTLDQGRSSAADT